ncbi:MAG: NosD domain-containing protein [Candidatus Micrarchaeaceae archaeon]
MTDNQIQQDPNGNAGQDNPGKAAETQDIGGSQGQDDGEMASIATSQASSQANQIQEDEEENLKATKQESPKQIQDNQEETVKAAPAQATPVRPNHGFVIDRQELIDKYGGTLKIIAGVIAVLIIVWMAYSFISSRPAAPIRINATVLPAFAINSCTTISKPGSYYLANNVTAPSTGGACMEIGSSDVVLDGNGHAIIGSGPFTVKGPVSYGVEVNSESNVSITNLVVSTFSYGIYLNTSNNDIVSNVTSKNATKSGIYLYSSSRNLIYKDYVRSAGGTSGAINITGGGNNTLSGDIVEYNSYYGISLMNSVGNKVIKSVMLGNPVDIACSGTSSFSASNKFYNSSCYVNRFCNFAYCSANNTQSSVTGVRLSPAIDSCGSINSGGTYNVGADLNFAAYMNASEPGAGTVPCILINASNVDLKCNGYTIRNAPYGILSDNGAYNVTVQGCDLQNNTYGLYLVNAVKFGISSIRAHNGRYGIYIRSSTDGSLLNSSAYSNVYGFYINGTTYATVGGFNMTNNTYGIALDNSTDVYLKNGESSLSSKVDLFCSTNTYNSTLLSATGVACTSTDCNWATSCAVKVLPNLSAYPLRGCTTITAPGQYSVEGKIFAKGACFKIDTGRVSINCAANSSIISTTGIGTAFSMDNVSNVTVNGCMISGFGSGLAASNTRALSLTSSVIRFVSSGVNISNSTGADISNNIVSNFGTQAYSFVNTNSSSLLGNRANSAPSGYGFELSGAYNNKVLNNTANFTDYGFSISGSLHNTVYDNHVYSGNGYSYSCSSDSSGVYAQYGRVNYGVSNANCNWLVVVSPVYLSQVCTLITSPDTISLTQDMVYPYNDTCFAIRSAGNLTADGTTIDCNGHTVFATDGGSFVSSYNTSGVTLKNCILIGFTNAAVFTSKTQVSGISILNSTFAGSSNSSVYINNSKYSNIQGNHIINSSDGIYLYEFNSSTVQGNNISGTNTGISLNQSLSTSLINNTISNSSFGIRIGNSQFTSIKDNIISNSLNGLYCSGSTTSSTSKDLGGNICPSVNGCAWITSPGCR